MNISVRYQSRGGNTKTVAELIAKTAGVAAEVYDAPVAEPIDVLFIGGGVYAWDIDKGLKAWLRTLTPDKVKTIAPFSTAGGFDGAKRIAKIAKASGVDVLEQLPVKVMLRSHAAIAKSGSLMLKDSEEAAIATFARCVLEINKRNPA
ncbi:MAG: flavodoxin family protein [Clostridiales bacterium]|jgi:flavodoxin|nr:flavodoxin family protein [Clostridiales bacterium]